MQRIVFFILCWLSFAGVGRADELNITLSGGSEILVHAFGEGRDRVLWVPSEFGFRQERELALAKGLAQKGMQVWIADIHSSYFIPPGRDSLSEVPVNEIAELVRQAQPEQGRLYLLSTGRGAALSLMAAREVQLSHPTDRPLGGLVLFHPNLHARPPLPGEKVEYLPVSRLTNQPIYLIQPGNSAKRWYLKELTEQLEQGGSDVFRHLIPNVSDGFHLRPDFTEHEAEVSVDLPELLLRAMRLLNIVNEKERHAERLEHEEVDWSGKAFRETLQPFPGQPDAPALKLSDVSHQEHDLSAYRGKVVLLNFWATWCPPCVKEIPSLGRLRERLAEEGLVVLSVDIGESAQAVNAFLEKTPASFPVLLDTEGVSVQDWNIRAFPTTYLLDKQGKIRYAYFGALEWDDAEVIAVIRELL